MKSDYQMEIIGKVRALRMSLGYSQNDVAALLGISNGQVGNIESPNRPHKYTLFQLSLLCDEFKIPIEELFLGNSAVVDMNIVKSLIDKIIEYEK